MRLQNIDKNDSNMTDIFVTMMNNVLWTLHKLIYDSHKQSDKGITVASIYTQEIWATGELRSCLFLESK